MYVATEPTAATVNRYWFGRALFLAAVGGATIGVGLLMVAATLDHSAGEWATVMPALLIGVPVGALAGALDALPALVVLVVLVPRQPGRPGLAGVVAGLMAAVIPAAITFHAGWPDTAGGAWSGIGLTLAAFAAGALLTPIALRPRRP